MTEVPAVIPVTIPEVEPIEAFALLIVQVPPDVGSPKEVVAPMQTVPEPVIVPGKGLTVTIAVALQDPTVYEIVAVPAVMPDTMPVVPTVAFALLLLQVPPAVASPRLVVEPTHTPNVPEITAGEGLTVTVTVVLPEQPPLVVPVTV